MQPAGCILSFFTIDPEAILEMPKRQQRELQHD
jgi:hypothetical protein